ncbi:MAG: hypothetical protein ACR2M0_15775 [Chloroflexia bacterium]
MLELARITRREIAWACLGISVAVSLFLGGALFTGRVLSPADMLYDYYPWHAQQPAAWPGPSNGLLSDSVFQFEPWMMFSAERLHAGALPLWNPDNMLGAPFVGNMQSAVFYPLNWPYFIWPGGFTLLLRAWLKLFTAALGMYLLARTVLRVGPVPASLAALTFTFGAFLTVWLLHPHTSAAVLLPWLWWATARLVARPGASSLALLAGAAALTLLSGHPELAYHEALATGLFLLFLLWQGRGVGGWAVLRALGLWGGAYALGVLLAAVQLLPFAEYLFSGSMTLLRRVQRQDTPFWMPLPYAWTAFSPDLLGNPARHNWWGMPINYNESNNYAGLLPLVLAPLALLTRDRAKRRLALFLAVLLALTLAVVYGVPGIYQAAVAVPGLRFALNHRLVVVAEFALGLLAALGAAALISPLSLQGKWVRGLGWPLAATAVILVLLGIAVPWAFGGAFFGLPSGSAPAQQVWGDSLWRTAALLAASAVVVGAVIWLGRVRPRWTWAGMLLPVVLAADLWQAHAGYVPTVAPRDYFPATAATRFLQAQAGLFRAVAGGDVWAANANLAYGLADLRGNDAIEPVTYHELAVLPDPTIAGETTAAAGAGRLLPSHAWNLLNVRYVMTAPGDDPNYLPDARQETNGGKTVGEILGGEMPGQTFTAGADNLAGVEVLGATYGRHPAGTLVFHLKTDPAATDLVTKRLDTALLPDNSYWRVTFPPIRSAKGRRFYFYFESPDARPGGAVTLWYNGGAAYAGGTRLEAGAAASGDLVFRSLSLLNPDAPWFERVLDGGTDAASIFANRRALDRAWLTHRVEVEPDAQAQLGRLLSPEFDAAGTALLGAPLPPTDTLPPAPPPTGSDAVTITEYSPEEVRVATRSLAPGVLILSDQFYPGWAASVDGVPAPIVQSDHALRGVYLSAGAHTVDFAYRPVSFQLGAWITAAALLVLAALVWEPWRRRGGRGTMLGV